MFDDRITLRLGAAVTAFLIAAVVFALQIDFHDLGKTVSIQVYMKHPGPLLEEADVQLGGRAIGRVHTIRLVTAREARKQTHPLYPDGGVVLGILVKDKYAPWLRLNSELFVNKKGLVGEAYLEIAPPPADEDMKRPIRNGDVLRGVDPARMEHIVVTSFQNAQRFGALLQELKPSMDMLRDEIVQLNESYQSLKAQGNVDDLQSSASQIGEEIARLQTALEGAPSLQSLTTQARSLQRVAKRELESVQHDLLILERSIERIGAALPRSALSQKFAKATLSAQSSIKTLRGSVGTLLLLAARMEAGMGTIGQLLNDEEFVDDRKRLGRYIKRHPWEFLKRPLD